MSVSALKTDDLLQRVGRWCICRCRCITHPVVVKFPQVKRIRAFAIQAAGAPLAIMLVLAVPTVAAAQDRILAVGGQNFHVETLGESGPTIVFEAGLGNDASTWKLVAGPVAKFARVVLYDRAGLEQSLPTMDKNSAVTADQVATN